MILTYEQLRSVTFGAAETVLTEDGYFSPRRFTGEQADFYRDTNQTEFYRKTFATPGVRLSFFTDAKALSFDFRIGYGSSRRFFAFDLYANGVMINHVKFEDREVTPLGSARFCLPAGEKKVELCLPWSCSAELKNVTLEEATALTPAPRTRKMICFGDSITHGYDSQFPSHCYAALSARLLDADETNKGIGADVFCPGMIHPDPVKPDLITVAYGTNDVGRRGREEYEVNCRGFYQTLCRLYPGTPIFAILPIFRGDEGSIRSPFGGTVGDARELIRSVCAEMPQITVLESLDYLPHFPAFYSPDFLHPNDAGFHFYASGVVRDVLASGKL